MLIPPEVCVAQVALFLPLLLRQHPAAQLALALVSRPGDDEGAQTWRRAGEAVVLFEVALHWLHPEVLHWQETYEAVNEYR